MVIHHFAPAAGRIGWEASPVAIASGQTDVMTETCRLTWARICNTSGGSLQVSMADRQSPPVYILPPTTLPSGGWLSFYSADNGDLCVSGLSVTTNGTGIDFYAKGIKI
jgi:hypothetical protein